MAKIVVNMAQSLIKDELTSQLKMEKKLAYSL
jgi:hypothetical protein